MEIRAPRPDELAALQEIERAAGEMFAAIGMPEIAADEPFRLTELAAFVEQGRAWVAVETDVPVGYLVAEDVDGNLHVEQVSVDPASGRRGIGRRMLDHAGEVAAAAGLPALTLTTFVEVPWNAPYYQRCGFRALAEHELTPGLQAVVAREADHGLDRWPRVCMRRDVPGVARLSR